MASIRLGFRCEGLWFLPRREAERVLPLVGLFRHRRFECPGSPRPTTSVVYLCVAAAERVTVGVGPKRLLCLLS